MSDGFIPAQLNEAQLEAVTAPDGPLLVIAGAGSGKTRTIVHRLAWLVQQGVPAHAILLLTFTRKAAREMLDRASLLLDRQLMGVQGGTFHAFAFSVLRQFPPEWLLERGGSPAIMDASDSTEAVRHCKDTLGLGKGDRSFPKIQTVIGLLSKARNKEMTVEEVIRRDVQHLLPHAESITRLGEAYAQYRRDHALLDYDDLLFELESMLRSRPDVLDIQRHRFRQILVDEYQDTNRVQARLVRLLAGDPEQGGGNIMAVGDDAQSIYAFRGATVHNILEFPTLFPGTRIVRLEENYRSLQPILNVANALLENAPAGYRKRLFSRRLPDDETGTVVRLYRPLSDHSQGRMAADRISELLETCRPSEIAVLFRAGYQSYHLEVELNRRSIRFRKYGGLRYTEASHVKDVLAFVRLVANPLDLPSFERVAGLSRGIGAKTARKLYDAVLDADPAVLAKKAARYPEFLTDINFISSLRTVSSSPEYVVSETVAHYRPRLEVLYPDDWPRRLQGLEEMQGIAASYDDLSLFLADLSLESPEEGDRDEEDRVVLSTVHSAKGLEWSAVLVLDLVEDRFPSRHALARPDDFEEERRLMYVACTRARDSLDLFSPLTLFNRGTGGQEPATPSPFVRELPADTAEEIRESYGGLLSRGNGSRSHGDMVSSAGNMSSSLFAVPDDPFADPVPDYDTFDTEVPARWNPNGAGQQKQDADDRYLAEIAASPELEENPETPTPKKKPHQLGYCRHKIFGQGKIVEFLPPDRYRVNFPGFGLKVIMAAYLSLEER